LFSQTSIFSPSELLATLEGAHRDIRVRSGDVTASCIKISLNTFCRFPAATSGGAEHSRLSSWFARLLRLKTHCRHKPAKPRNARSRDADAEEREVRKVIDCGESRIGREDKHVVDVEQKAASRAVRYASCISSM
jgi:hypothetical protein